MTHSRSPGHQRDLQACQAHHLHDIEALCGLLLVLLASQASQHGHLQAQSPCLGGHSIMPPARTCSTEGTAVYVDV